MPQIKSATPSRQEWEATAVAQVDRLLLLNDNWDSYGADRPDPKIIQSAKTLLASIAATFSLGRPSVSPTRTGGVLLEWSIGPRALEIELVSADEASFLYTDDDLPDELEGSIGCSNLDDPQFVECIRRLCA